MSNPITAQEEINVARACIWRAVKIDSGRRALEGDIETADNLLDDARRALVRGMLPSAQNAVLDAIGLLHSDGSRFIAENGEALEDAIGVLSRIDWT